MNMKSYIYMTGLLEVLWLHEKHDHNDDYHIMTKIMTPFLHRADNAVRYDQEYLDFIIATRNHSHS